MVENTQSQTAERFIDVDVFVAASKGMRRGDISVIGGGTPLEPGDGIRVFGIRYSVQPGRAGADIAGWKALYRGPKRHAVHPNRSVAQSAVTDSDKCGAIGC